MTQSDLLNNIQTQIHSFLLSIQRTFIPAINKNLYKLHYEYNKTDFTTWNPKSTIFTILILISIFILFKVFKYIGKFIATVLYLIMVSVIVHVVVTAFFSDGKTDYKSSWNGFSDNGFM